MRWNLEVAGILALGFALFLGIALVAPPARMGVVGSVTVLGLHALFGVAAGLFVVLIALVAAIVFLEINVPRMIATLGGAACAYFVLADIALAATGRDGGWIGTAWHPDFARGPEKNIRTWGQLGLTGAWADMPIDVHGPEPRSEESLQFADAVGRFLGVQLSHAPIVEILAAAHGVGEMNHPVVALIDVR